MYCGIDIQVARNTNTCSAQQDQVFKTKQKDFGAFVGVNIERLISNMGFN